MSNYYRKVLYICALHSGHADVGHGFVRLRSSIDGGTMQIGLRGMNTTEFGNYRIGFYKVSESGIVAIELKKDVFFQEEELREIEYNQELSELVASGFIDGVLMISEHSDVFYTEADALESHQEEVLLDQMWTNVVWRDSIVESAQEKQADAKQMPVVEKEVSFDADIEVEEPEVVASSVPDFLITKKSKKAHVDELESDYYVKIIDWKDLFQKYNIVEPFAQKEFYDCIEIGYDDLKYLPITCGDIHNNSFLLHGLYRYKHLLLGKYKEKRKQKCYILGVPGTYDRSEKILAPTFGFENFNLARRHGINNMNFGYWYTFF